MTEQTTPESFDALYQRAQLLFNQHRHADAAEWFQRALQHDPQHGMAMAFLALSWIQSEATHLQAVDAARRGIALEPESSFHHAVLAICVLDSAKPGQDAACAEGLRHAEQAVELDPDSDFAWAVKGQALARLRRWPEAEQAARQALAMDTTSGLAARVLSVALMNQGKEDDLKSLADMQLSENPEDDTAHVTAGFQKLRRGQHREACEHFREALRIDPSNEMARLGLIESFRSRSFVYRWYVQFGAFMSRFGERNGRWIMLAGFVGYKMAYTSLKKSHPGIAGVLVGAWLTFALWSYLARGIGSALMLADPFVRMAIRPRERWEGVCVGGLVLLALVSLALCAATGSTHTGFLALVCVLAAVPASSAFSNDHHFGKWIDMGAAIVAGICALWSVIGFAVNGPVGLPYDAEAGLVAIVIGVATSWIRMFGLWYR